MSRSSAGDWPACCSAHRDQSSPSRGLASWGFAGWPDCLLMHANANPPTGGDLRARRLAAGLSQEALARRAGCSTSTVRLVEHGYTASKSMLGRLALALDEAAP